MCDHFKKRNTHKNNCTLLRWLLLWWHLLSCHSQELEGILGERPPVELPQGEHVEEVNLVDYEDTRGNDGGARGEVYHEDDDDMGGHGPRVQCAHQ